MFRKDWVLHEDTKCSIFCVITFIPIMLYFIKSTVLSTFSRVLLASYPGPYRGGGERAWYTLHAHAPGDPRKMWGNRILSYTLRLSSIEQYVMQNLRTISMVTQLVAMETPAHAPAVCTRPFLLLLKGLGTRLGYSQPKIISLSSMGLGMGLYIISVASQISIL